MFDIKSYRNGRRAAITVELALAATLGILVLFLVIGLFSTNLKDMIVNSNINRMFANNANKTATVKLANDPTSTQVNVQLVGAQGLQWYLSHAQAIIDHYKSNPPNPNEQAKIQDLAMQATIARIGGILSSEDRNLFYNSYGIYINISGVGQHPGEGFMTSINGTKSLYFNSQNYSPSLILSSPNVQLTLIKDITNSSFH